MVESLDGVVRTIQTINPETLEFDVYTCGGYFNTSRYIGDPLGKLVDWYRPLSGKGQFHSQEFLYLLHKKENRPYISIVKGEGE